MKGRFAPSPTGRMHLGNVYSALLSWLSARSQDGGWVLRIEDLDPQRSRQEYVDLLEDDLGWLGLTWDERYVQSQRSDIYLHYLNLLKAKGLTYPCYCTRADIMATQAPHETDGRIVYAGTCRPVRGESLEVRGERLEVKGERGEVRGERLEVKDRKPATRLLVPDCSIAFEDKHYGCQSVNLAKHCGDFVVRRADGAWAYQLAVVVDDALMGVTEVVRGRDLLLSAPQQIYLYQLLGFDVPAFCHLPLLCNTSHQRLCKRDKSLDLGELRRNYSAEDIIGKLAYYAGIIDKPERVTAAELISVFDWKRVPHEDVIVCD